nr:MAG TPA: hypothetical protein [Caudoviricetes sp.]
MLFGSDRAANAARVASIAAHRRGGKRGGKVGVRRLSADSRCKLIKPARCLAGFLVV